MATTIGLIGGKGVGKTTLAQALIRALDYDAEVIKMADPLKNMLRVFGLTEEEIEGSLKEVPCDKLCGSTPRWAMQTLGTEWGRNCLGRDLWVEAWLREVEKSTRSVVIVDDVRFFNEAVTVQQNGGHLVYLGGVHDGDCHPSETEMHQLIYMNGLNILNISGQFPRGLEHMPSIVEYILRNTVNRASQPTVYDPNDEEIPF